MFSLELFDEGDGEENLFCAKISDENLEDGDEKLLADDNPSGDENSFFLAGGDEVILL